MTGQRHSIHVSYFDASALVMLYVDEADASYVRDLYRRNPHCQTTSLCLVEALGVLKRKRSKNENGLTDEAYYALSSNLLVEWRLRICRTEPDLGEAEVHRAVETLARTYKLDLIDAL